MLRAMQCQSPATYTPIRTWIKRDTTPFRFNAGAASVKCCTQQLSLPLAVPPPAGIQQQRSVQQHQQAANARRQQHRRTSVRTCAFSSNAVAVAAGGLWNQLLLLLSALSAIPWYAVGAVLLAGVVLGLSVSKAVAAYVQRELDPSKTSRENAELRAKVEDLQQLMLKLEPLAYKSMKLRFTKGVNKAVILGMVDTMLANKEVNIWWLPDQLERIIYFNMMTLMLSVLDEIVDGMSISFAGHNVRLQLTYLDVESGEGVSPAVSARAEALVKSALAPVQQY